MTKNPKAKAAPASKPAQQPIPDKLPATIVNALPAAAQIMKYVVMAGREIPELEKQLTRAKKGGAIQMARAFVALYRLEKRIDEVLKPLFSENKETPGLLYKYKTQEIPALFEAEGVSNVPLTEGFRVGISSRFLASIKPDQKQAAYDWLRENGLGDLIQATVNAQTLSAALKKELEEKNVEAPNDLFNVALVPNTSVTTTEKVK